jgi:hypothetical protein
MAKQTINLGTAPTGVGGDTPRSAFTKTQINFDELYTALGATGSPSTLPTAIPVAQGGTGGTTQAAARTGLGLGAAAVAAILGTVSQSGGVPTGAIIENVVNANGRAIKFADGTMICISPQLLCPGPTVVFGALYISPSVASWTYPAAFVGTVPSLTGTTANSVQLIVTTLSATFTGAGFAFYHPQSTAGNLTIYGLAVGRWF